MIKKIIIRTVLTIILIPVLYIAYLTTVILIENKRNNNNASTAKTSTSNTNSEASSSEANKSNNKLSKNESEDDWPKIDPFAQLREIQKEELKQSHAIRLKVYSLLENEKYDELEDLAQRYRLNKETFTTKDWKLNYFYDGLSLYKLAFGADQHAPRDPTWVKVINRLKKWVENKPNSITAKIALAETWLGYGFVARGHGYANEVTETQWLMFHERIENAEKVLLSVKDVEEKCPYWWITNLSINKLSNSPASKTYEIFQEAISFEPEYLGYYKKMAATLIPRWGGSAAKWKKFIETSADNIGYTEGDILYANLVWQFYSKSYKDELALEANIDLNRVARGVKAMKALY